MIRYNSITQEELKLLVTYDPETGLFTRITKAGGPKKSGGVIGTKESQGYLCAMLNGKTYKLHRLAWVFVYGSIPDLQVDHINGVRTDNRISNLRLATNGENQQNRSKPKGKNKYIGVTYAARINRYVAEIMINGQRIRVGTFISAEEAYAAYLAKKQEVHPFQTIIKPIEGYYMTTAIPLIPVQSAQISGIGYDEATQTLAIKFSKGEAVYEYAAVPREVHSAFMASDSKGKFFQGTIKPQYEHKLIPANDGEADGKAQAA